MASNSKFVIFMISGLSAERPAKKLRDRAVVSVTAANLELLLRRPAPGSPEAAGLERLLQLTKAHQGILIKHWDVNKSELLKDSQMAPQPDQTVLFKRAHERRRQAYPKLPRANSEDCIHDSRRFVDRSR